MQVPIADALRGSGENSSGIERGVGRGIMWGITMKDLLIALGLLSCPAAVFVVFGNSGPNSFARGTDAPSYSLAAGPGQIYLAQECAGCHGRLAGGTDRGPNLIQPDYGPERHSDAQFRRAVRHGMPAGRGYNGMPATPGVSEADLNRMIVLVRELQRVNGIR
jgi:mono/diheme cytochrome c family protein